MTIKPSSKKEGFMLMKLYFPAEAKDALRMDSFSGGSGRVRYLSGGIAEYKDIKLLLPCIAEDIYKMYLGGVPFLIMDAATRSLWNYTTSPYEPKKRYLFQYGEEGFLVEDVPTPVQEVGQGPGSYSPFFMENKDLILLRIQKAATLFAVTGRL